MLPAIDPHGGYIVTNGNIGIKFDPIREGMNPTTYPLQEQWETWISAFTAMEPREALVRIGGDPCQMIKTVNVPKTKATRQQVQDIKAEYRNRLMRQQGEIDLPHYHKREEPTIRHPKSIA